MKVRCEYCGNYIDEKEPVCSSCGSLNKLIEKRAVKYKYDQNEKKRYKKYDSKISAGRGLKFLLIGLLVELMLLFLIMADFELPSEYFNGLFYSLVLFLAFPLGLALMIRGIIMIALRK